MTIEYNNSVFRVRFEYRDEKGNIGSPALQNIKDKSIVTVAIIQEKVNEVWEPIAVAGATRNPKDKFNKGRGRRTALARAMSAGKMPTDFRSIIWDWYSKAHSDGKLLQKR